MRPKQQDGVLAQEAHGKTVLLRVSDGGYYALDDVGAVVWELCDGSRTIDDLVAAVCAEFDAPADVVRADVEAFVEDLTSEDLLGAAA